MSRSDIFNGFMYILLVGGLVTGAVSVFLVAISAGGSLGIVGFLGSLVLFPITWLVGPLLVAIGSRELGALLWFGISLAFFALPILFTIDARRERKRAARARRSAGRPVDRRPVRRAAASRPMPRRTSARGTSLR